MIDNEQRVETMIAEGLRICQEAIEKYRPVVIVAAYSGGDDSIVTTHFAMENLPGVVAFNADTLIGLKPVREHIVRTCGRFKWPLEVRCAGPEGCPKKRRDKAKRRLVSMIPARDLVAGEWREGATAYEEKCLNFGFPGKSKEQHSIMYSRLKERPIQQFLREHRASKAKSKILFVSGIRRDESAIRAGYKRAYAEGHFGDVWVNPFYWRTATDFAAYRDEFGLPLNPVKPRCGISGECCCETFPSDRYGRRAYAEIDPEFGRYIDALESRVMEVFPWGYGESPPSWWTDAKRGQGFLFDVDEQQSQFQPMCVGCHRGR